MLVGYGLPIIRTDLCIKSIGALILEGVQNFTQSYLEQVQLVHGVFHEFHFSLSISSLPGSADNCPYHPAVVWRNFCCLVHRTNVFPGFTDRWVCLCKLVGQERQERGIDTPGVSQHFTWVNWSTWILLEITHHPGNLLETRDI
jgi:hypothetical protein